MKLIDKATMGKQKRILIASIDEGLKDALSVQLDSQLYDLTFVQKGYDVISAVLETDVDILILDLDFHGMVSVDVLPILRKLRPRLPVVLVSDDFTHRIRQVVAEQGLMFQTFKPRNYSETRAIVTATEKIIEKRQQIMAQI